MEKDFNNGGYWDAFERGLLHPAIRPTPQEVGEFVVGLLIRLNKLKREVAEANHEAKCSHQEFETFALEVSNLAIKRRTFGKNA